MLKNLMVHLDQSPRSVTRLKIAVAIARANGARLVGMFGQRSRAKQVGSVTNWPPEEYISARDASKQIFMQEAHGLRCEWVDINRGSDSEIQAVFTQNARYFDLIVMGQHNESSDPYCPPELVEEVLANSGRPVLIIPYVGEFSIPFKRPLIAWNASPEASHALNDSFYLINGCEQAIILAFDSSIERAEKSCEEVSTQLACHGVKSRADVMVIEDIGIMDMLLNNACDQGADLLVMGAHSQLGFPFFSRGAGTRHILRTMVLPVLMSS